MRHLRGTICVVWAALASVCTAAVTVEQTPTHVHATWNADGHVYHAYFVRDGSKPLVSSLSIDATQVAHDLDVSYHITTGPRLQKPGQPYIFFDYPVAAKGGAVHEYTASASRSAATTVSFNQDHSRASLTFPGMAAGPFTGPLTIQIYENSPLLHLDAALTSADGDATIAYAYEPLLSNAFTSICYTSPTDDTLHRDASSLPARPIKVRNRTIVGETAGGSVALFPPHAFLFPRDFSTNFGFAQAGPNMIGLRQDLSAGNKFVPWIDAPPGRTQHMAAFVLFTKDAARPALDRVKRYTHNDTFARVDGHITFVSHLHPEITVAEIEGRPTAPALKKTMTSMGINVFHLAEFHLRGHSFDTGTKRLNELKAMFDLCQKYSDDDFLLVPGEEANTYLPGHWIYLFPKPTYLTLKPTPGKPPVEEIPPFGTVHHPQNEAELMQLLADEHALAWTTHPRIKGSEHCPDLYRDRAWYQSPTWLGATWKAMPADLSEPRLGTRSLQLLDEMNTWPSRGLKFMPSEIDTFDLDPTHEFYAPASVNYLRLPAVPPYSDYSPILTALRAGDFFTTTGEILIHSAGASEGSIKVDASWTFPLAKAVVTTSDGVTTHHVVIPLDDGRECSRRTFTFPLPKENVKWYRVELWDVALDGAYTQPAYLTP